MGILETAEKWAWDIALKKIIAAMIGFLASKEAIMGLAWLEAHGVHIDVDISKFSTEMILFGIGGFTALHDFLKLRFPESKWL